MAVSVILSLLILSVVILSFQGSTLVIADLFTDTGPEQGTARSPTSDKNTRKIGEDMEEEEEEEEEERKRFHFKGLVEDIEGEDVYVTTRNGKVRGKRINGDSSAGGLFTTADWFLGLPYAKPPIGELRFSAPEPALSWTEVRNATRYGAVCPQLEILYSYASPTLQDEDCLFLNIYSPTHMRKSTALFPVMVYIHGGSYRAGSGSVYAGHVLSQYGVVVVTINYRLGVLGFLSAKHPSLPGNYGLMDQIEALRWVKRNIRMFGGDPDKVTIFGNSAGASSIGLLSTSPLAIGLYAQIIMQSGSPRSFWSVHDKQTDLMSYVRNLSNQHHCNREDMADLVTCLRDVRWTNLTFRTSLEQLPKMTSTGDDLRPVPDGRVLLDPSSPDTFNKDQIVARAMMIGVTSEEWTRHLGLFLTDLFEENGQLDSNTLDGMERETFHAAIDHVMRRRFGFDDIISTVVQYAYTNWTGVDDPLQHRSQYIKTATLFHAHDIPVYIYLFNHHKQRMHANYHDWQSNYHEMELNYVFGSPYTGINTDAGIPDEFTVEEQELSRRLMKLWTEFAKHGNPSAGLSTASSTTATSSSSSSLSSSSVNWTRFSPVTLDYLLIDSDSSSMCQHLRADKMFLWNDLVPTLVRRLQRLKQGGTGQNVMVDPSLDPSAPAWIATDKATFGSTNQLWILAAVCIGQMALLLLVIALLSRSRRQCLKLQAQSQRVPNVAPL